MIQAYIEIILTHRFSVMIWTFCWTVSYSLLGVSNWVYVCWISSVDWVKSWYRHLALVNFCNCPWSMIIARATKQSCNDKSICVRWIVRSDLLYHIVILWLICIIFCPFLLPPNRFSFNAKQFRKWWNTIWTYNRLSVDISSSDFRFALLIDF